MRLVAVGDGFVKAMAKRDFDNAAKAGSEAALTPNIKELYGS
jgi:hypothetical protein